MSRRLLGTWACRSGNEVDVYLIGGLDGPGSIECSWDVFPLSVADRDDWSERILPEVVARAGELLERPGAALVVRT